MLEKAAIEIPVQKQKISASVLCWFIVFIMFSLITCKRSVIATHFSLSLLLTLSYKLLDFTNYWLHNINLNLTDRALLVLLFLSIRDKLRSPINYWLNIIIFNLTDKATLLPLCLKCTEAFQWLTNVKI